MVLPPGEHKGRLNTAAISNGKEFWIMIQNPEKKTNRYQNTNPWGAQPLHKITSKSVHNFLSNAADRQKST